MIFPNRARLRPFILIRNSREMILSLRYYISSPSVLVFPTTGDVNLGNPFKLVSARFLNDEVIIFPFVGGFVKRYSKTMQMHNSSSLTSTDDSTLTHVIIPSTILGCYYTERKAFPSYSVLHSGLMDFLPHSVGYNLITIIIYPDALIVPDLAIEVSSSNFL